MTEITVYNQGFGFVKEIRTLNLRAGRQSIAVEDVPSLIESNSVSIRSLDRPNAFSVLEQNYQYDLISRNAILNKAVGSKFAFRRVLPNGQKEVLEGTLLSSPVAIIDGPNGQSQTFNGMVIRTDDGRILLDPTGEIEVQSLPSGLISKPTLVWELDAEQAGAQRVELSYLTQGMRWNCDYVMTLDAKSSRADFRGWVTLNNQSGATFENARLKLLAGEVNRVQPQSARDSVMEFGRGGAPKAANFQQESLFEYHLYTLQRPASIRNRETKQISLLEAGSVPYRKKLIVDSMLGFGMYYPSEGEVGTGDIQPQVRIEFTNDEASNLGMPLPKGNVKVYQRDQSGSVQMLGEDAIEHTPKNEKLSLAIGRSFDVRATRKRVNFRRISTTSFEQTFEIEVRNRKEVPERVHVYERHWGDWKISNPSMKFEKLDAQTIEFVLDLPANGTQTVKYTVTTRW